jgi:putative membrane protein
MRRGPRLGTPEEFDFRKVEPPAPPAAPDAVVVAPPRGGSHPRLGRIFLTALGALLAGLLVLDAVDFLAAQYARSAALGALFSVLIGVVLVSAAALVLREAKAYQALRHVEHARARLLAPELGHATVIASLEEGFGGSEPFARFRAALHGGHDREQLVRLFAETVLRPLDLEAYQAVGRAARDVAVVTAVAPTALLDTAIMLWRTLRMVRRLAEIYGHRAGLVGTWYLLRRIVGGAAIVAATDVAGNLLVQQLGGALAEVLAAKLGEGTVAATRVARIGLYTMQLCRILPFEADDLPTMRRLLETVLTAPRGRAG